MLRHPIKPTVNTHVDEFIATGGKISPATNSGKITIGYHSDRSRARERNRFKGKGRAA